jgi:flagellar motor switch protein FliN/FliY
MRSAEAPKIERSEQARQGVNGDLLRGVRVALDARLGEVSLSIEDVMALKPGSVVTLQKGLAETIDLYLNDNLVARGEVVAVGDKYGVRIVEIANAP